jgi:hypothetical protein
VQLYPNIIAETDFSSTQFKNRSTLKLRHCSLGLILSQYNPAHYVWWIILKWILDRIGWYGLDRSSSG